MDNPDNPTDVVLSDEQLLEYLDAVEKKTYDYIESLTDEMLYECPENCEHTRLELVLRQFRHISFHTGMLNGQTALATGKFPMWVSQADKYVDDGISGTTFERPGVQRLLDDAKTGRINLILCKDLSRFGRNYIQVGQYTDYIFPMYNIRFIALTDNVDTANSASSGMDMMPIMNVFNEWHSANTSKKIRAHEDQGGC